MTEQSSTNDVEHGDSNNEKPQGLHGCYERAQGCLVRFPDIPANDDKSLWRALAYHKSEILLEGEVLEDEVDDFIDTIPARMFADSDTNKFVLGKTGELEDGLQMTIRWYTEDGCFLDSIRYSEREYDDVVHLLLCDDCRHCLYIEDEDKWTSNIREVGKRVDVDHIDFNRVVVG